MSHCCRKDQLPSGITRQKITSGWWITVPENQVLSVTIYRGEMSRCFLQLCGTAYHRGIIPYLDRVINVCAIALRSMEAFIVWPPFKCEDASGHVHQSGIFRNPRRWNSPLFCWRDQDPGCSGGVGLFETTSFMWSSAEEEQAPGQPSSHVLLVKSYSKGAWLTDVTANFPIIVLRELHSYL